MNDLIVSAAQAMLKKKHPPPPSKPMLCLALVRLLTEAALFHGRWQFYDTYLVARSTMPRAISNGKLDWSPYAADLEASMKALGYAVPFAERMAGDLIFNWQAAKHNNGGYYGHVGVLLERDKVLENIAPKHRPYSKHFEPYMSVTPIEHFSRTLVARLQRR